MQLRRACMVSMVEKGVDVSASVQDVENHHIVVLDAVDDDILHHRKTSQAGA
jgi:hypothetical protein